MSVNNLLAIAICVCEWVNSMLPHGAGVAAEVVGVKRPVPVEGADDGLTDNQKKAFLTRKQRKMFEGARKREDAKAERVATLKAKKAALH